MKRLLLPLLLCFGMAVPVGAQEGLISVKSSHGVVVTANRLERLLKEKEITLFARIDHAAGARQTGFTMRPTLLLLFGNPAADSPFIQRSRTMGIDLPLKALIWEDRAGQVWFTYNAPDYLARRHGITELNDRVRELEEALSALSAAATRP